jgi:hypothetical protein
VAEGGEGSKKGLRYPPQRGHPRQRATSLEGYCKRGPTVHSSTSGVVTPESVLEGQGTSGMGIGGRSSVFFPERLEGRIEERRLIRGAEQKIPLRGSIIVEQRTSTQPG